MAKFSQKEIENILAQPLKLFPPAKPGKRYGPSDVMKPIFIDDLKIRKKHQLHTHNNDNLLLFGGSGGGKCLGKDTPILMFDGTIKPVQDIEVGDLLIGPDSKPRKVISLARGREEMFKVIPVKGEPWICNKSHILSLKTSGYQLNSYRKEKNGKQFENRSSGEIVNISVDEYLKLSPRNQKCLKLWRSSITFLNSQTLELDPYFLGIWLGDGNSSSAISSGQTNKNGVLTKLKKYNLINNKHIPHEYLTSSITQRLCLLAGLIDTGGYVHHHNYIEIVQKNKQLADDILFLARSLGFAAYKKECKKSCTYKGEKREGVYFRITISGEGLENIPTRLERKKLYPRQQVKNALVTGFTLKSIGEGDYYGFTLEGEDRLFLLGNFTVTHNTQHAVARGLWYLTKYPGCNIIIGAKTYKDVKDIVIEKYRELLSINGKWDHPMVVRYPTDHQKTLELAVTGQDGRTYISTANFMHFDDWERIRGREAVFIHFEEISQLDSQMVVDELQRRLRSPKAPILQMLCTTNPPESTSHWMYPLWALQQFLSDYDGDPIPIGAPCQCQYCQECLNKEVGEYLWDETNHCPRCGSEREGYYLDNQHTYCEGNQYFWRVVMSSSADNPHLVASHLQTLKAGHDKRSFELFAMGRPGNLRNNSVYSSMSLDNIRNYNKPLNLQKDIIWSFDFNVKPQCSVIAQETHFKNEAGLDDVLIDVVDEIVLYEVPEYLNTGKSRIRGAGPQHVAKEFMKRYPDPSILGTIYMYGDPAGLNNDRDPTEPTKFQIIYDLLTANGYKVVCTVKKVPGKTKIAVIDRVNTCNWMLKDPNGSIRIKINPKCEHLIKSLSDTRWSETILGKIDVQCDKNAAKATNVEVVHLITHPADAFSYYLIQKYHLIQDKLNNLFIHIPDESRVDVVDNGTLIKEQDLNPLPEKTGSLLEFLKDQGYLDEQGQDPTTWFTTFFN